MGFFDRLKNAVNPQEGDDYENDGYDNFGDDNYFDDPAPAQNNQQNSGNYGYSAPQQSQSKAQPSSGMGFSSGALELKVVKPEKYDSTTAQKIADHPPHGCSQPRIHKQGVGKKTYRLPQRCRIFNRRLYSESRQQHLRHRPEQR